MNTGEPKRHIYIRADDVLFGKIEFDPDKTNIIFQVNETPKTYEENVQDFFKTARNYS